MCHLALENSIHLAGRNLVQEARDGRAGSGGTLRASGAHTHGLGRLGLSVRRIERLLSDVLSICQWRLAFSCTPTGQFLAICLARGPGSSSWP